MEAYAHLKNIERFESDLKGTLSEDRRALLQRLLSEERYRLAQIPHQTRIDGQDTPKRSDL